MRFFSILFAALLFFSQATQAQETIAPTRIDSLTELKAFVHTVTQIKTIDFTDMNAYGTGAMVEGNFTTLRQRVKKSMNATEIRPGIYENDALNVSLSLQPMGHNIVFIIATVKGQYMQEMSKFNIKGRALPQ
jgi:hypothetical protein